MVSNKQTEMHKAVSGVKEELQAKNGGKFQLERIGTDIGIRFIDADGSSHVVAGGTDESVMKRWEAIKNSDEVVTNELAVIANESGLQPNKIEALLSGFGESYHMAKQIAAEAGKIVVTDETQTELMAKARKERLVLKNVRVSVESTRKSLKEQSLREGKAIDGMANIIKALIAPVEQHLEKQEKFAEVKAAERKAKLLAERTAELSAFVDNVAVYDLENITDAAYDAVLAKAKQDKKDAEEAAKRAEAERIAKEKAEAEERERQRKENERLKAEAEVREAKAAKERAAAAKKLEVERKKREAIERKQREELEAKAKEERRINTIVADFAVPAIIKSTDQAKTIGATLKSKYAALSVEDQGNPEVKSAFLGATDYLRKSIDELEAEAKAKAEHEAATAPDKEKMLAFAKELREMKAPSVSSDKAKAFLKGALVHLAAIANAIEDDAERL